MQGRKFLQFKKGIEAAGSETCKDNQAHTLSSISYKQRVVGAGTKF
jgi:hypothetical protein